MEFLAKNVYFIRGATSRCPWNALGRGEGSKGLYRKQQDFYWCYNNIPVHFKPKQIKLLQLMQKSSDVLILNNKFV